MALKTHLIAWMFIITEIYIYGYSSDVEFENKKCDISESSIECMRLSGKFLPSDSSPLVRYLYIVESNMSSLSADDFAALENLVFLYIDSCIIATGNDIFSSIKSLETLEIINSNASEEVFNLLGSARLLSKLSLEANKITHLKKGMLEIMKTKSESPFCPSENTNNLATASLKNNKLSCVKNHVSDSWSQLKEINLSYNEISAIEANAFEGLSALKNLRISYNRLKDVFDHNANEGVFKHLSHLEEIDLSHNEISTIEANAFEGLLSLKKLDISYNRLCTHNSTINMRVFDNFSLLEEIDLSHNEIGAIEGDAFQCLPSLKKLDLSHNCLKSVFYDIVQKEIFVNLLRLEEIDLSHNKISRIGENAFKGLSALKILNLTENSLSEDFDATTISLPAGCVFQSLVATCPGLATDSPQSGEHYTTTQQSPLHNVTTPDLKPQNLTEQKEEKQQEVEWQPELNGDLSHEDQRSAPKTTTGDPQPPFRSDGAGVHGGLDFAGVLGAALLVVFTGLR